MVRTQISPEEYITLEREFSNQIKYKLNILPVVRPSEVDTTKFKIDNEAYTEDGILFNSDFLNDLTVSKAIEKAIEVITKKKIW